MFRGPVTLIEPVTYGTLMSREVHDVIAKWAQEHRATNISWNRGAVVYAHQQSLWHPSTGDVVLENCIVSPEEFDANGVLMVGSFKAVMYEGRFMPDPKEETPTSMAESFRKFVTEFFDIAHISPDMQEEVWNMSLKQFCNVWADTAKKEQTHQDKKSISRRQLLAKPHEVLCTTCGRKGGFAIIDGFVGCQYCGTIYGDIDNIPD